MSIDINVIQDWENVEITYVKEHLKSYNMQFTSSIPFSKPEPVNLILKEDKIVIGGLLSCIYWQCCHIDILWIEESHRKHRYGSILLQKIQDIAVKNKCRFIHLDTMSFQALDFYKKNGFTVFGELSGYPDGITRYYLKKDLTYDN